MPGFFFELSAAIVDGMHLSEAVDTAKDDAPVRKTDAAQRSGCRDAVLVDALFGQVHSLNTDIEVIVDRVVDAGVQLASVERVDREAERAAAAGVRAATEVERAEFLTPRVAHSC